MFRDVFFSAEASLSKEISYRDEDMDTSLLQQLCKAAFVHFQAHSSVPHSILTHTMKYIHTDHHHACFKCRHEINSLSMDCENIPLQVSEHDKFHWN